MPRNNNRLLTCGVVALAVMNLWWGMRSFHRGRTGPQHVIAEEKLECGHWCLIRCCHLLGLPLSRHDAVRLLPSHPGQGSSLLGLKQALEELGFRVVARSQSLDEALHNTVAGTPVILHLTQPDHFVVLSRPSGRDVIVFDAVGQRRRLPLELVRDRFDGYTLTVQREDEEHPLPPLAQRDTQTAPCLQFRTLYVDQGDIPVKQASVTYEFPFKNLGALPLKITRLAGDCSCLHVEGPTEVAPHADGVIRATFSHRPGESRSTFEHEIHVETNDPVLRSVTLIAAGNTNTALIAVTWTLDFGEVVVGQTRVRRCFVQYNGQEETVLGQARFDCTLPDSEIRVLPSDEYQQEHPLGPHLVETGRLPGQVRVVEILWSPQAESVGKRWSGHLRVTPLTQDIDPIEVSLAGAVIPPDRAEESDGNRSHPQQE
jgi:hypothetical protein